MIEKVYVYTLWTTVINTSWKNNLTFSISSHDKKLLCSKLLFTTINMLKQRLNASKDVVVFCVWVVDACLCSKILFCWIQDVNNYGSSFIHMYKIVYTVRSYKICWLILLPYTHILHSCKFHRFRLDWIIINKEKILCLYTVVNVTWAFRITSYFDIKSVKVSRIFSVMVVVMTHLYTTINRMTWDEFVDGEITSLFISWDRWSLKLYFTQKF